MGREMPLSERMAPSPGLGPASGPIRAGALTGAEEGHVMAQVGESSERPGW